MDLISFEEAYNIVMNSAFETGTETISFTDSLNRVTQIGYQKRYGHASF